MVGQVLFIYFEECAVDSLRRASRGLLERCVIEKEEIE